MKWLFSESLWLEIFILLLLITFELVSVLLTPRRMTIKTHPMMPMTPTQIGCFTMQMIDATNGMARKKSVTNSLMVFLIFAKIVITPFKSYRIWKSQ